MSAVLDQAVNQIVAGLRSLANVMRDPDTLHLASTHVAMERLHACLPLLSNADVAFAFLCDRDGAGALVGANHAVEYLTRSLGLSRREAFALLEQGRKLYGEPEVPEPEVSDDEEDRERKEQEAQARRKKAREAQERARRAAEKANAEKKRIITDALKDLNAHADPGYEEILAEAMEAAESHTAEELRKFVRDLVKRANKRGRDYDGKKDPSPRGRNAASGSGNRTQTVARISTATSTQHHGRSWRHASPPATTWDPTWKARTPQSGTAAASTSAAWTNL